MKHLKLIVVGLFFGSVVFAQLPETIQIGIPGAGAGDTVYIAFTKVNTNDQYLDNTKADTIWVQAQLNDSSDVLRAEWRSDISDSISDFQTEAEIASHIGDSLTNYKQSTLISTEIGDSLDNYTTLDSLSNYALLDTLDSYTTLDSLANYVIGNNIDSLVFNSGTGATYFNGKLQRDSSSRGDGLVFYNHNSEIALNIGYEMWVYAQNNTGTTITNGTVVRVVDASAELPRITVASNTLDSCEAIGMATEDILNGETGHVTTSGIVGGLSTTGCTEGLPIYTSKNGTFVDTLVEYPLQNYRIGYCLREHGSEGFVLISIAHILNNHKEGSVIFANGDNELASDSIHFNYTDSEDSLYVNLAKIDTLFVTQIDTLRIEDSLMLPYLLDNYMVFIDGSDGKVDTTQIQWDSENRKMIIPTGGNDNHPKIAFGDGNTGIYEVTDNTLVFTIAGNPKITLSGANMIFGSSSSHANIKLASVATSTNPNILPRNSDDDTGPTRDAEDELVLCAGGVAFLECDEGDADSITIYADVNMIGYNLKLDIIGDTVYSDSIKFVVHPPHLSAAFMDSSETPAMSLNGWELVTNEDTTLYTVYSDDFITFVGDTVTFDVAGDYDLKFNLSFTGGPGDIYEIAVFLNNVLYRYKSVRGTSNNDSGNITLFGHIDASVGDNMKIMIRNTADNDDATFTNSQLVLDYMHN